MMLATLFDRVSNVFWGDSAYWTLFGLVGNVMFTSRFVVQWYASEKLKQSIIPKNFWHLSLVGGLINLVYAVHVWKLPFILGSLLPPVVAFRNLALIAHQGRDLSPAAPGDAGLPTPPAPDDDASASMLAAHEAAANR